MKTILKKEKGRLALKEARKMYLRRSYGMIAFYVCLVAVFFLLGVACVFNEEINRIKESNQEIINAFDSGYDQFYVVHNGYTNTYKLIK